MNLLLKIFKRFQFEKKITQVSKRLLLGVDNKIKLIIIRHQDKHKICLMI